MTADSDTVTGKRYYWLRLYDDFFTSKRIKKLRRMAGGDTYTIIYLKMQLTAMKNDGILKWTGLEDNIADELSLDLDESPDDIKVTLAFLLSCGLAETSDNVSYYFPYSVCKTLKKGVNVPVPMLVTHPDDNGYEIVKSCGYEYGTENI